MSVTTSSASAEPPPLLFGHRSPASPTFSAASNPASPTISRLSSPHRTHTPPPPNPSYPAVTDSQMSTPTHTDRPQGQNHDREDSQMADSDDDPDEQAIPPASTSVQATDSSTDAMDITPDRTALSSDGSTPVQEVLHNGGTIGQPVAVTEEHARDDSAPAPDSVASHSRPAADAADANQSDAVTAPSAPRIESPVSHPSTPPTPVDSRNARNRQSEDSSDEDEEEDMPWRPLIEDTSGPDERELKEIEQLGEHSALDHAYWQKKAHYHLGDPDYSPGASGRIDWKIEGYHGTKEKPNKELIMRSPVKNIGGHDWQIKFFPKGNNSDYLSVYVDCVSLRAKATAEPAKTKAVAPAADAAPESSNIAVEEADAKQSDDTIQDEELQTPPLPLLGDRTLKKRPSVAAQILLLLYNPSETRVNYYKFNLHRFSPDVPDFGWTHFYGPHYDIHQRQPGQRAALLRSDQLAFRCYIRLIDDPTGCLGQRIDGDMPWSSPIMTGLQGLSVAVSDNSPGGNLISITASLLHILPFRRLLCSFPVPDPQKDARAPPKPLISAFLKILYRMRTQVQPGDRPIEIDDLADALDWYGIDDKVGKKDVIELRDILRIKLEHEMQGTPFETALDRIFGVKKNVATCLPSYRLPVEGVDSVQAAVESTPDLIDHNTPLPQVLIAQLDRQSFDESSRSWKRITDPLKLNSKIIVGESSYTLYGFIAHEHNLHSNLYYPVLRPMGPDGLWFKYNDNRHSNAVEAITWTAALGKHEGTGPPELGGIMAHPVAGSIAYVVMYVRDDIDAFSRAEPTWEVPHWLVEEVDRFQKARDQLRLNPTASGLLIGHELLPLLEQSSVDEDTIYAYDVITSDVFTEHEGAGTVDLFDEGSLQRIANRTYKVPFEARDTPKDIRKKLGLFIPGIKDDRQIRFFFIDSHYGCYGSPRLEGGNLTPPTFAADDRPLNIGVMAMSRPERRMWVHILDVADLPKDDAKEVPAPTSPPYNPVAAANADSIVSTIASGVNEAQADGTVARGASSAHATAAAANGSMPDASDRNEEDTPMTEADETAPPQDGDTPHTPTRPPVTASAEDPAVPSAVHFDVEMAGNGSINLPAALAGLGVPEELLNTGVLQDLSFLATVPAAVALDGPPPSSSAPDTSTLLAVPPPPAPAPSPYPPRNEIYIFLKLFDAEAQKLFCKGSYIVSKSARVDHTMTKLLKIDPEETPYDMFEEESIITTAPLRRRKTFLQEDLQSGTIIIVAPQLSADQKSSLRMQGKFDNPQAYLRFLSHARNFPATLDGTFTFDYYSGEYYSGCIRKGQRHGNGKAIYEKGDVYEGQFCLGQRHSPSQAIVDNDSDAPFTSTTGTMTYQDNSVYTGSWSHNQHHGHGSFTEDATGNTYVGNWKEGKRYGEGVTHWKVAQEAERGCRICWEEEAEAAFYDCGHVVACLGCARRVDNCPVCRRRVLSAVKLYYVS